jgi:hypothetical protein
MNYMFYGGHSQMTEFDNFYIHVMGTVSWIPVNV